MASNISVCKFNCICNRADCARFHVIADIDERNLFREKIYSTIKPKDFNETDPEGIRRANCRNGQVCIRKDCNYKHSDINEEGRKILNKKWFQERRKMRERKLIEDLEEDKISKEDAVKIIKELFGFKE